MCGLYKSCEQYFIYLRACRLVVKKKYFAVLGFAVAVVVILFVGRQFTGAVVGGPIQPNASRIVVAVPSDMDRDFIMDCMASCDRGYVEIEAQGRYYLVVSSTQGRIALIDSCLRGCAQCVPLGLPSNDAACGTCCSHSCNSGTNMCA